MSRERDCMPFFFEVIIAVSTVGCSNFFSTRLAMNIIKEILLFFVQCWEIH
jgi:hypothetical protein